MLGKISSISDLLSKFLGTLVFIIIIIIIITLQTSRETEVLMEYHSRTGSHKLYIKSQDLNTAPSDSKVHAL